MMCSENTRLETQTNFRVSALASLATPHSDWLSQRTERCDWLRELSLSGGVVRFHRACLAHMCSASKQEFQNSCHVMKTIQTHFLYLKNSFNCMLVSFHISRTTHTPIHIRVQLYRKNSYFILFSAGNCNFLSANV